VQAKTAAEMAAPAVIATAVMVVRAVTPAVMAAELGLHTLKTADQRGAVARLVRHLAAIQQQAHRLFSKISLHLIRFKSYQIASILAARALIYRLDLAVVVVHLAARTKTAAVVVVVVVCSSFAHVLRFLTVAHCLLHVAVMVQMAKQSAILAAVVVVLAGRSILSRSTRTLLL
jgi:hypothetical protein